MLQTHAPIIFKCRIPTCEYSWGSWILKVINIKRGPLRGCYLMYEGLISSLGEPDNSTYLRKYRNNHFLNSHSGTMFTCDVCGMTTNHKDTLMRHKRGHNKANQVTCDLCGKICHHRIALRKVFKFIRPICSAFRWVKMSYWKRFQVNIRGKFTRRMLFAISVTRNGFKIQQYLFLMYNVISIRRSRII